MKLIIIVLSLFLVACEHKHHNSNESTVNEDVLVVMPDSVANNVTEFEISINELELIPNLVQNDPPISSEVVVESDPVIVEPTQNDPPISSEVVVESDPVIVEPVTEFKHAKPEILVSKKITEPTKVLITILNPENVENYYTVESWNTNTNKVATFSSKIGKCCNGNNMFYTLTELSGTYYFRVKIDNLNDASDYSDIHSVNVNTTPTIQINNAPVIALTGKVHTFNVITNPSSSLIYSWQMVWPVNNTIQLTNPTLANASFTPVADELYVAFVTISDGTGNNWYASATVIGLTIKSFVVSPVLNPLTVNNTIQLHANATYGDDTAKDVAKIVKWASSNADVATIDTNGILIAKSVGITTVSSEFLGLHHSILITVN